MPTVDLASLKRNSKINMDRVITSISEDMFCQKVVTTDIVKKAVDVHPGVADILKDIQRTLPPSKDRVNVYEDPELVEQVKSEVEKEVLSNLDVLGIEVKADNPNEKEKVWFEVRLNGEQAEDVYAYKEENMTVEQMKKELVDVHGYDTNIEVKEKTNKKSDLNIKAEYDSDEVEKEVVDEVWNKMNDNEKHGCQFGLFPSWVQEYKLTKGETVDLMGRVGSGCNVNKIRDKAELKTADNKYKVGDNVIFTLQDENRNIKGEGIVEEVNASETSPDHYLLKIKKIISNKDYNFDVDDMILLPGSKLSMGNEKAVGELKTAWSTLFQPVRDAIDAEPTKYTIVGPYTLEDVKKDTNIVFDLPVVLDNLTLKEVFDYAKTKGWTFRKDKNLLTEGYFVDTTIGANEGNAYHILPESYKKLKQDELKDKYFDNPENKVIQESLDVGIDLLEKTAKDLKCPKCGKPIKEDTDGDDGYCQGHDLIDTINEREKKKTAGYSTTKIDIQEALNKSKGWEVVSASKAEDITSDDWKQDVVSAEEMMASDAESYGFERIIFTLRDGDFVEVNTKRTNPEREKNSSLQKQSKNDMRFDLEGRVEIWVTESDIRYGKTSDGQTFEKIINSKKTDAEKIKLLKDIAVNVAYNLASKAGIKDGDSSIEITIEPSIKDVDMEDINWEDLINPEEKIIEEETEDAPEEEVPTNLQKQQGIKFVFKKQAEGDTEDDEGNNGKIDIEKIMSDAIAKNDIGGKTIDDMCVLEHEQNYHTLYMDLDDGSLWWSEEVDSYTHPMSVHDGETIRVLQLGNGSVPCNCDWCVNGEEYTTEDVDGEAVSNMQEVLLERARELEEIANDSKMNMESRLKQASDNSSLWTGSIDDLPESIYNLVLGTTLEPEGNQMLGIYKDSKNVFTIETLDGEPMAVIRPEQKEWKDVQAFVGQDIESSLKEASISSKIKELKIMLDDEKNPQKIREIIMALDQLEDYKKKTKKTKEKGNEKDDGRISEPTGKNTDKNEEPDKKSDKAETGEKEPNEEKVEKEAEIKPTQAPTDGMEWVQKKNADGSYIWIQVPLNTVTQTDTVKVMATKLKQSKETTPQEDVKKLMKWMAPKGEIELTYNKEKHEWVITDNAGSKFTGTIAYNDYDKFLEDASRLGYSVSTTGDDELYASLKQADHTMTTNPGDSKKQPEVKNYVPQQFRNKPKQTEQQNKPKEDTQPKSQENTIMLSVLINDLGKEGMLIADPGLSADYDVEDPKRLTYDAERVIDVGNDSDSKLKVMRKALAEGLRYGYSSKEQKTIKAVFTGDIPQITLPVAKQLNLVAVCKDLGYSGVRLWAEDDIDKATLVQIWDKGIVKYS